MREKLFQANELSSGGSFCPLATSMSSKCGLPVHDHQSHQQQRDQYGRRAPPRGYLPA